LIYESFKGKLNHLFEKGVLMQIEIFTLCNVATKDGSGKLNILGTFNIITAKQTPIKYPSCELAIRLRFEKSEGGSKTMKINFVGTDGKPVLPSLDETFIVRVLPDESTANVSLIVLIPQMKLKNFGDYSINLVIDDHLVGSSPFYVRKLSHE
jgi:hypothetical protein